MAVNDQNKSDLIEILQKERSPVSPESKVKDSHYYESYSIIIRLIEGTLSTVFLLPSIKIPIL